MRAGESKSTAAPGGPQSNRSIWLWLSLAAALLALIGNIIGLSVPAIYARTTPAVLPQALAQDAASLVLVVPFWLVLAVLALRGSLRAILMWLGVLTFTVYNYFIYTFSIPFGPLFPLWVAVLGLAIYALIGGVTSLDHNVIKATYASRDAIRTVAWALLVVGVLFAILWLSEDVPALLSGSTPKSLTEAGCPTNPIHILDLGFFLPAALLTGTWLLRGRPLAFTLAPIFLVFLILTGIPILLTPVVQTARGAGAEWGVTVPIGTLTVLLIGLLIWLLSTMRPAARRT
jgi:hypothetical protein